MSAADTRRDLILEAIVTPDATPYGAAIRNKGRAALAELEAELARKCALNENLRKHADARMRSIARLSKRGQELEAELERLTVGRATLEDQTNRAELAEARVAALEAALERIAASENYRHYHPKAAEFRAIARAALVLSGGSE